MKKQPVRIAEVKGFVIKRRCRKAEFTVVEGVGLTSEEAIENFKLNLKQAMKNWRVAKLAKAITFDAVRVIYDDYTTIERPLMPNASDNVEYFEYVA